jgi:hypothetical protein
LQNLPDLYRSSTLLLIPIFHSIHVSLPMPSHMF